MDSPFGVGDAPEDGDGFRFDPGGELAAGNQLLDFGKISLVVVLSLARFVLVVGMRVLVKMDSTGTFLDVPMIMLVIVAMALVVLRLVMVVVRVVLRQVHIEFDAGDGRFLLARNVQVIAGELELFQFAFKPARVHAEIQQRANKHVAGYAADEVEVESLHELLAV